MTAQTRFSNFSKNFAKALKKQTGMDLATYSAYILAGQNPSMPSKVSKHAKRLIKRRREGKKIKPRDIDQLLDDVEEYFQYQYLTSAQRVSYGKNVVNKIIPSLQNLDLDSVTQRDVSGLVVDDKFKAEMQELVENEI